MPSLAFKLLAIGAVSATTIAAPVTDHQPPAVNHRVAARSLDRDCSASPLGSSLAANAESLTQLFPCSFCADGFGERGPSCSVEYDVPAACAGAAGLGCPLLFFFHGSGGTNAGWARAVGGTVHAPGAAASFIGVYPQGANKGADGTGSPGWNTAAIEVPGDGVDDMAFVASIADRFRDSFGWDGRLYAYGSSNGAAMVQKLAANPGMGFSGIAAKSTQLLLFPEVAGAAPHSLNRPSAAAGTTPIAYVSFHGTADGGLPYEGGRSPPGGDASEIMLDSVANTNEIWRVNNGCDGPAATQVGLEAWQRDGAVNTATHSTWPNCGNGARTEHYKVVDGGHGSWTIGGKSPTAIAFDFFAEVEALCAVDAGSCPGRPLGTRTTTTITTEAAPATTTSTATTTVDRPEAGVCSDSCAAEFVGRCMPYKVGSNEDFTAQQAYGACRAELDAGVGPLITVAGCVAGCDSSTEMIAARDDGEPEPSVDPTTTSTTTTTTTTDEPEEPECSDECSRRFTICSRNQQERQDLTPAAAFDRCRMRIDRQMGWLAPACAVGCISTDEMLSTLNAR